MFWIWQRKWVFGQKKLDGYCGYAEYWGKRYIYRAYFSHVDVNDEDDNEWKYDPYGGIVDRGRGYYGSSAVDKGALIAVLYALKAVKESKCSLKRKVRLIIGTDNRRYFVGYGCIHEARKSTYCTAFL